LGGEEFHLTVVYYKLLNHQGLSYRELRLIKYLKIILPSRMQLGRLVASLKNQVQKNSMSRSIQKITPHTRKQLDMLLAPSKVNALSALQDFKRSPPEPSVKVIHDYMDRLSL
jgi:hypothetical protein